MLYDVRHRTTLEYEDMVSIAHHMLHLKPRNTATQRRLYFSMTVEPEPTHSNERNDYFGNPVHYVSLQQAHHKFIVESKSRIELNMPVAPNAGASPAWDSLAGTNRGTPLYASEFVFASPYIDLDGAVADYARVSFVPGRPVIEAANDLTSRIFHDFEYRGGVSDISTPVHKVLEMRQGVCQDFAHLQIACLRSLGLAARYVSGYLLTHPPEGKKKLVGSDASHAWLSLWCGQDWIDFDPTNDLIPRDEHITLAWGRDYGDVSPTSGFIIGGGGHSVKVAVDVTPVEAAAA